MVETKLIRLTDGTLVEVSSVPGDARLISGGLAEKVASNLNGIQDVVIKACRPVIDSCLAIAKEVKIEQTEVELGLGFEAEGNIYITKATATANITIKFVLRP